ncbi:protein inturned isoform X1 [Patella vulgata]|uniref:protein inturned isoform X1 n=2 Tax=Patella vulgata TaxID=6465 RepID=UPI0024A83063|nr:protein inturned isoform X1 [Patella vulgata]
MSSRFFDSEREIRMLKLSDENKLLCDEILSEFEAMDFDEFLSDDQMDSRRSYITLGSLLFYKNWLLSSHLSWSDQSDINLYLKHHALYHIMASKSLDNLVIWLEVFPTARCDSPLIPLPGYVEPRGRWFLLIVGLNNYLMCSILETGGISQQAVGNPSVDIFFVDQIKSTLEQLDEDDVSMAICCEESICSEEKNISLANVDKFLPKIKTKDDNISPQKIPQSPKTPVSPMKSDPGRYKYSPHSDRHSNASDDIDSSHGNIKRQGSKLSYGSNDSTGSSNSAGQQKIQSKVGRLSSVVDISGIGRSLSVLHLDTPVDNDHTTDCNKVTRGRCNVLFNYIQIDSTSGVIITPTDTQLTMYQSAISTQLINSIYHCCSNLRKSFHYTRQTEKPRERKKSLYESSDKITDVEEQGVLFNLTPNHPTSSSSAKKSQPSSLSYWVIGRRFREEDKEIYVCFHESVPQSTVEMAFTLGFGS